MVLIDTLFNVMIRVSLRVVQIFMVADQKESSTVEFTHTQVVHEEELVLPRTFKTVQDILKTEEGVASNVSQHTILYTSTVSVPVYENATIEFDTQIGTIPYGEAIIMHEARGRFYSITWKDISGWVLRDDCADRASRVYPDFRIGQEHSVDHPNTAHVRAIIGDVFGASRAEYPLQAGEYVLYKLWRKGMHIIWPHIRPRVPGLWHTILKGVPRIHMGVMPKTGSVMEYMMSDEVGHVAYVEAVFPDDTITISEVNFPDSGIYNERSLLKEEWKSLKPVFIQIV